jgi:hypothetical protein
MCWKRHLKTDAIGDNTRSYEKENNTGAIELLAGIELINLLVKRRTSKCAQGTSSSSHVLNFQQINIYIYSLP